MGRRPEGKNGTRKQDYPQLSVRVPPTVMRDFREMAHLLNRSPANLVLELIKKETRQWGIAKRVLRPRRR